MPKASSPYHDYVRNGNGNDNHATENAAPGSTITSTSPSASPSASPIHSSPDFRTVMQQQQRPSPKSNPRPSKNPGAMVMMRNRTGSEFTDDVDDNDNYDDDYAASSSSNRSRSSYLCSFVRWCCTFQHFCYVVQLVNCGLVCALIYLAMIEYPKIEALEAQVEEDKKEIAALSEEVREKQEGQIQDLHKAVQQEQQFNFLSLAGFFTLLTCLISMFHMTTHVQKMNQPKIQRKIIAILWMSPIYSVTSFLTLVVPSVEGWMAIIKDFYESYCIYVFLSFLIAVLGEGSREKAVDVLAKHAGHLDRPTRCLACLYEPQPDVSDHAKANAVMTQCQIYCLQFTLVRPLTTMFCVFVLRRKENKSGGDDGEGEKGDDEFNAEFHDEAFQDLDNSEENKNKSDGATENIDGDNTAGTDADGETDNVGDSNTVNGKGESEEKGNDGSDGSSSSSSSNSNSNSNNNDNDNDNDSSENDTGENSSAENKDESLPTDDTSGIEESPTTVPALSPDDTMATTAAAADGSSSSSSSSSSNNNENGSDAATIAPSGGDRHRNLRKLHGKDSLDSIGLGLPPFPPHHSETRGLEDKKVAPAAVNGYDEDPYNPTGESFSSGSNGYAGDPQTLEYPSVAPIAGRLDDPLFPTVVSGDGIGDPSATFPPSLVSSLVSPLAPVAMATPGLENTTVPFGTDYNASVIGVDSTFFPTLSSAPTMAPLLPTGASNETTFDSGVLVDQTKNYLKSPGFAVAMVVNVSIFFAFSGLLKLYHAVRDDLVWCRPFPKFLTIKAVVFLTFWQGLAILLSLVLTAPPDEREEAYKEAHKYQNLLICVEMLLVAISQWCVFPAVEWEPGYEPRQMHTPGLGIKDFVSDVGQIVNNRSRGRQTGRRRKKRGSSGGKSGLYHVPGTSSVVSSQYDGFDGQGKRDSFDDEGLSNSFDSDSNDEDRFETNDQNDYIADNKRTIRFGSSVKDPSSMGNGRIDRTRSMSESTGGGDNADDENSDDDIELL